MTGDWWTGKSLPITHYQLPITHYQLPITTYKQHKIWQYLY
ncbi:hypothetical protein PN497_17155 [Sphaerospermopsis kisseleviana CS-549]|uniref:Uncharacterized protein n=1 Tax=Sphaerospermopsis kisseleviana CS-549 TaxID=3021783 RepID=A0ABT4ZUJ3_9CYAN|nr:MULTISPECIES: hypothetical protein [Sphaerospermopsis]MDB9443076.1 hypothetical protein [Sphaerospermopsis kisseleviana CS-549]